MNDKKSPPSAEDAHFEEATLELENQTKKSQRVMTDRRLPKKLMAELIRVLGLPGLVQEFTLHVKKQSIIEVECRYFPFAEEEPEVSSPAK